VWLFGLEGKMGPVQPGTPVSRTAVAAPPAADRSVRLQPDAVAALRPTDLTDGKRIFTTNCAVCHGDDGKGGHTGGAPLDKLRDLDAAIATVTNGRNSMPPFGRAFTPEQIRDVTAYVVQVLAARADGNR
jgi:mono/diheme cytochrome c family protein